MCAIGGARGWAKAGEIFTLPFVFWLMPSWVPAWVSQMMTSLPENAVRPATLTPWLATLATLAIAIVMGDAVRASEENRSFV